MATVIATVQSISGQAWARDENGNLRELRAGDALTVGETLITAEGAVVSLMFANNEEIQVAGGQSLLMTLNMASNAVAAEGENTLLDPEVEALLASLSGEGDILESLEAPATGNTDVSGGGVSSIVQLMRIAEAADPITFGKIWQLMARGGSVDSLDTDSSEFGYQSSAIAELSSSPSEAINSLGNADTTVPNIVDEQDKDQVDPSVSEESDVSAGGNEQQPVVDDGGTTEKAEEEPVVDDGGTSDEENEEEPVVDDGGTSDEENEEEPDVDDGGTSDEENEEEPAVDDGGTSDEENEEEPVVDDGGTSDEENEEEPVVDDGGASNEENEEEPVVDDGGTSDEESEEGSAGAEGSAQYQLTLTNYAGDASFNNSFGFYIKDAAGNPTDGMVVWNNVKADAGSEFVLNGYEQKDVGFFIVSNGGSKNPGLENETLVNFKQIDGVWQAFAMTQTGEVALNAQDDRAPVLFDNAALNPNGSSYVQDGYEAGSLNWEDIYVNGDGDFNDVNIDVVWQEVTQNNDSQQEVDQPVTIPTAELPTQSIIQSVSGHVVGGSAFLGTLASAAGLNFSSIVNSHSANTYTNDQGYLSVDRSGRDKAGAIESKEALLVTLTEDVNSISFDIIGKVGAAKWVAFNADGQQVGGGEWIGSNGLHTFETSEPFKYIAFEGGLKSAFAVKLMGYEDVNGANVHLDSSDGVFNATEAMDVLFGGDGADTFKWTLTEAGGTDTVVDFNLAQGDILDIADLLPDATENLDSYLSFKQEGGDAVLQIHVPNNAQESVQTVVIKDVNLTTLGDTDQEIINSLISSGNLKVDS